MTWRDHLHGDPMPWLLEDDDPAVRAAALERLGGRPGDDPDVVAARAAAMRSDPIASILRAQDPEGWWEKPGPGYAPKYTGTVWQVVFLAQMGADPADPGVRAGCEYVLSHAVTAGGGFGASGAQATRPPPPAAAIHCLNGNLLQALLRLGHGDDARVRGAVEWAAHAVTGRDVTRWYASGTSGPGFSCAANERLPCAWGALKEMGALALVPEARRTPVVRQAIGVGIDLLLSVDPSGAEYPMGWGNTRPNGAWFRPGFPLGYVGDVLETVEVLAALGRGSDPRLTPAVDWVESQQDGQGRWRNRHTYNGKMWVDVDRQGQPSKWVTLRACAALRAVHG